MTKTTAFQRMAYVVGVWFVHTAEEDAMIVVFKRPEDQQYFAALRHRWRERGTWRQAWNIVPDGRPAADIAEREAADGARRLALRWSGTQHHLDVRDTGPAAERLLSQQPWCAQHRVLEEPIERPS